MPEAINMLDGERFRLLNVAVFSVMGVTTATMVLNPKGLNVPYENFELDTFNHTLRLVLN